MHFIRARSDEQKNKRLEQIVQAALELYETTSYDKITLASIAQKLDFTRANLYKYVKTKEEIFLVATAKEMRDLVTDLADIFGHRRCESVEEFAQAWSEALIDHERLLGLISILFSIIERNVSLESLASFKGQLYGELARLAPLMKRQFPSMSDQQIETFINLQIHHVAGLYPSTRLTGIQREAVKLSGISYEVQDFVPVFSEFLLIILKGMGIDKCPHL